MKRLNQLGYLYEKYKELNPESESFKAIEEKIVDILGDKATALQGLTKDTDAYRESLEKLSRYELTEYYAKAKKAAKDAKTEFANAADINWFLSTLWWWFGVTESASDDKINDDTNISDIIGDAFQRFNRLEYEARVGVAEGQSQRKKIKRNVDAVILAQGIKDALEEAAHNYSIKGDIESANAIFNSDAYTKFSEIDLQKTYGYIEKIIEGYLADYTSAHKVTTKSDVESAASYAAVQLMQEFGLSNKDLAFFGEIIAETADSIFYTIEDLNTELGYSAETTQKQYTTLSDIQSKYGDIASKVKELASAENELKDLLDKQNAVLEAQKKLEEAIAKARADYIKNAFEAYINGLKAETDIADKQQSIDDARAKVEEERLKVQEAKLEIEEKQKAVQEAQLDLQKAQEDLEYARNNRSERVFNAVTGLWERQANQKTVQSAQEKVRQATEKVESATKDVEKAVENVNKTLDGVISAENNVQKAIDNLNKYLQDKAISEIKDAIAEGRTSPGEIDDIINKWLGDGGGSWGAGVKTAIATAVEEATVAAMTDENVLKAQEQVKTAKNALNEYLQKSYFTEFANLFTLAESEGRAIKSAEVQKLVAKYRALGLDEESMRAATDILDNLLGRGGYWYVTANPQNPDRQYLDGVNAWNQDVPPPSPKPSVTYTTESGSGAVSADDEEDDDPVRGVRGGRGQKSRYFIDADFTRRLLSAATESNFASSASKRNILYGNPLANMLSNPLYSNSWQNASTNDNRSYVINGVPIPKDAAKKYTIAELFDVMSLV